jgi:hypothetical protein
MYYKNMDYDNETLVKAILLIDPEAHWVNNRYCEFCAQFLYVESLDDKKCKKCKTEITDPTSRALPFLTSATAIEKLILWLRKQELTDIIGLIDDIYSAWLRSSRSQESYKLEIVMTCIRMLNDTSR